MSSDQPRIMTEEARYGVRLNYIIFPIGIRELRHALAKNGYELSPIGEIPAPPTRIRFSGTVARKDETTVRVESDTGEIGVVERSLEEACSSFMGLAEIVSSELEVNLHSNVKFYWIVIHCKIVTGKVPRREIAKIDNKEYMNKFSQIIGEDLTSFSIRLCPKDAFPNNESWLDVAIEPDIANDQLYHIGIVFRNPNKDKTEMFVKDLENNLLKLIGIIEAQ
jgi:hypothetical protein